MKIRSHVRRGRDALDRDRMLSLSDPRAARRTNSRFSGISRWCRRLRLPGCQGPVSGIALGDHRERRPNPTGFAHKVTPLRRLMDAWGLLAEFEGKFALPHLPI